MTSLAMAELCGCDGVWATPWVAELTARIIEAVEGREVAFGTSDSGGDEESEEEGGGQLPGSSSSSSGKEEEEDASGEAGMRGAQQRRGSSQGGDRFPSFARRPRTKRPRLQGPLQSAPLDGYESPSEGGFLVPSLCSCQGRAYRRL
jgi:hypothetical protein